MKFHFKRKHPITFIYSVAPVLKRVFLVVILVELSLLSCNYVDPFSALATVPVNDRFKDRNSYNDFLPPTVSNSSQFNFAVITDTHYYDRPLHYIEKLQDHLATYGIEFIVVVGDITQAGQNEQIDYYLNDKATSSVPVYPAIGNHDLFNNGFSRYSQRIGRSVYNFSVGDSFFLFLDTANGTLGRDQRIWYEEKLKENTLNNVFVFSHYSLTDGAWQTFTTMPYPIEVYNLISLNDQYNVDYFISGHLHVYNRKELRGVQYFIVNEAADNQNSVLLVQVDGTNISYRTLSSLF